MLEPCSYCLTPLPLCVTKGLPRSLRFCSNAAWVTTRRLVLSWVPKKSKFPTTGFKFKAVWQWPLWKVPHFSTISSFSPFQPLGLFPLHIHISLPLSCLHAWCVPHYKFSPLNLLSFKLYSRPKSQIAASDLQNPRRSVLKESTQLNSLPSSDQETGSLRRVN